MTPEPTNKPAYIMENEFFDYLNYVLLDYDDERCQAHLKKMMAQIDTAKKDKPLLD